MKKELDDLAHDYVDTPRASAPRVCEVCARYRGASGEPHGCWGDSECYRIGYGRMRSQVYAESLNNQNLLEQIEEVGRQAKTHEEHVEVLAAALEDGVRSHEPCEPDMCWCIDAKAALRLAGMIP